MILIISPAMPNWIRDEIGTLDFRRKHVYQSKEQRKLEAQLKQQFIENMNR